MQVEKAKRLSQLQKEKGQIKRLLGETELEEAMFKDTPRAN